MKTLTIMLVMGLLTAGHSAATDAGSCYTITDQDRRAACLAKAYNDTGRCYAIKDQQLRAECQAEARK